MKAIRDAALVEIAKINELEDAKVKAIGEIEVARQGILNAELNAMIDEAINNINRATTADEITDIEATIFIPIEFSQSGKAEAKEELLGDMGTPCTGCTAVEVTDGTTSITLYNPKNVQFKKIQQEQ